MTSVRPLSLAHLSTIDLPPPELVRCAAAAGFELIGALRLTPTSDGRGHDVLGDAPMRRETRRVLADTGLAVLDVEVFRLRPGTDVRTAEPLLEVGADLGARHLLCTVEDEAVPRRAECLAALAELASSYGLTCMVEPMLFSSVRTPAEAQLLLRAAGHTDAGILVDALHFFRAGASVHDLSALDPTVLRYVQLCDAVGAGPACTPEAALREAVDHRLAPGEGDLPLADLMRRIPAGAPVSVEAPNPAGRQDPQAWIRHLASATRNLMDTVC